MYRWDSPSYLGQVLVKASVDRSTAEDACSQLDGAHHSNAVRYQLKKDLAVNIKAFEEQINMKAMLEHPPSEIKGKI